MFSAVPFPETLMYRGRFDGNYSPTSLRLGILSAERIRGDVHLFFAAPYRRFEKKKKIRIKSARESEKSHERIIANEPEKFFHFALLKKGEEKKMVKYG